MRICTYRHTHDTLQNTIWKYILLENITTEPHAHDISADIVRVWLSGYIIQHTYMQKAHIHAEKSHTRTKYTYTQTVRQDTHTRMHKWATDSHSDSLLRDETTFTQVLAHDAGHIHMLVHRALPMATWAGICMRECESVCK